MQGSFSTHSETRKALRLVGIMSPVDEGEPIASDGTVVRGDGAAGRRVRPRFGCPPSSSGSAFPGTSPAVPLPSTRLRFSTTSPMDQEAAPAPRFFAGAGRGVPSAASGRQQRGSARNLPSAAAAAALEGGVHPGTGVVTGGRFMDILRGVMRFVVGEPDDVGEEAEAEEGGPEKLMNAIKHIFDIMHQFQSPDVVGKWITEWEKGGATQEVVDALENVFNDLDKELNIHTFQCCIYLHIAVTEALLSSLEKGTGHHDSISGYIAANDIKTNILDAEVSESFKALIGSMKKYMPHPVGGEGVDGGGGGAGGADGGRQGTLYHFNPYPGMEDSQIVLNILSQTVLLHSKEMEEIIQKREERLILEGTDAETAALDKGLLDVLKQFNILMHLLSGLAEFILSDPVGSTGEGTAMGAGAAGEGGSLVEMTARPGWYKGAVDRLVSRLKMDEERAEKSWSMYSSRAWQLPGVAFVPIGRYFFSSAVLVHLLQWKPLLSMADDKLWELMNNLHSNGSADLSMWALGMHASGRHKQMEELVKAARKMQEMATKVDTLGIARLPEKEDYFILGRFAKYTLSGINSMIGDWSESDDVHLPYTHTPSLPDWLDDLWDMFPLSKTPQSLSRIYMPEYLSLHPDMVPSFINWRQGGGGLSASSSVAAVLAAVSPDSMKTAFKTTIAKLITPSSADVYHYIDQCAEADKDCHVYSEALKLDHYYAQMVKGSISNSYMSKEIVWAPLDVGDASNGLSEKLDRVIPDIASRILYNINPKAIRQRDAFGRSVPGEVGMGGGGMFQEDPLRGSSVLTMVQKMKDMRDAIVDVWVESKAYRVSDEVGFTSDTRCLWCVYSAGHIFLGTIYPKHCMRTRSRL